MILAAMDSNPILISFLIIALGIILIGTILRLAKQTHVIIYIVTGVVLGPQVMGLVTDADLISSLGSIGLVLLLFFIGMEISLHSLVANWRVSVIGTLIQIALSIVIVWILGYFNSWPLARIITLGFVISISSTAVIIKLLQDNHELETKVGQNVLGILLVQDILIVPMFIILGYLSGKPTTNTDIALQITGAILITALIIYLFRNPNIKMPFHKVIKNDHETQIFFAFGLCFGFSVLTGFFGLSTALGAFIAGIVVASSKSTQWFHDSLYSVKVIFVALFFISVGMLIDIDFLIENIGLIALLVAATFVANNVINSYIMHSFKLPWKDSVYAGALLSQIGEFSFVLGNLAYFNGIITDFGYQTIVAVISLTLLLSPVWIKITSDIAHRVDKRLARNS
ncbi:MAG: cation:proton antiporter [Bacteroidota bacterium]